MPFINADRIKETTITIGTGNIALLGAVLGFRAFYPTLSVGDTFKYFIVSTSGTEWEAGLGTVVSATTLARTTVQSSSNANAAVNFSAGLKEVGIGPTAGGETPWNPVTNTLDISVNALNDVAITSPTANQVLKYSGTEWTNQTDAVNVGTVTSVAATGGTGISVTGSPITGAGTLAITNTAPDQTVSLTAGTGISATGTYPNFTITNTAPSSGGTVTSVSVSSANGFGGTVATATSTPAITLTTSITGVLKGNASAILAAVAGTDYVTPSGSVAYATSAGSATNANYATAAGNAASVTTNANLTGHVTSLGNAAVLGSFTSAQLATALTDETGTGANVFATSPTLVTPLSNSLSAVPVASGPGNSLTIAAGSGVGVGKGGDIILQPGAQGSSGGNGKVIVGSTSTRGQLLLQNGTNAPAYEPAFVIKNAAGANIFYVDATRPEVAVNAVLYFGPGNGGSRYLAIDSQGGFAWRGDAYASSPDVTAAFTMSEVTAVTKSNGGNYSHLEMYHTFSPASGASPFAGIRLLQGINQTGTASGIIRGLYVDQTLTSVLGSYRAIETKFGGNLFNCGNPAYKGLTIAGAASQTANLQEWQNSAGTALASVDATGNIKTTASTVATLAAAATAGAGARAFVSDSNATTFAAVVAGGGANGVPVYSDGTNWRIG